MYFNPPSLAVGFSFKDMNFQRQKFALMSLFIALGTGLGFAFMSIPNVELISTTIFISGYILGVREGMIVGIMTEGLYSLLNPMGMAAPPLFVALVFAMGCTGLLGGLYRKINLRNRLHVHLGFGLAGFTATVNFILWTTFSYVLLIGISVENLITAIQTGIVFSILHILSNTIIFSTIVPLLIDKLYHLFPKQIIDKADKYACEP